MGNEPNLADPAPQSLYGRADFMATRGATRMVRRFVGNKILILQ